MAALTFARNRVLGLMLLLVLITGSLILSGMRKPEVLDHMKNYADNSGFNEFLEKTQSAVGETSASMKERVAEYLGNSQLVDPLDERPLVADEDPDMEVVNRQKYTKSTGAHASAKPATAAETAVSASTAMGRAGLQGDVKADFDPQTGRHASAFGFSSGPASFSSMPETAYPPVADPSKENTKETVKFRFYSHNVKNGAHDELELGEVPWDARKRLVINSIKLNAVQNTVVFLQEPLKFQIDDILEDLNFLNPHQPEWSYVGGGRNDGRETGEHVPIIFKNSEWSLIYNDTFWLNERYTRRPLSGWDAKYPRIATYATLQHKSSGQFINVLNTHLDHKGKIARKESATLLAEKMRSLNKWPSFIVGDLNAVADDASHKELAKHYMDVHELVPDFGRYGHPDYSVTGFSGKYLKEAKRIDYVFAPRYTRKLSEATCDRSSPFSLQVVGYGILHSKYGGVYMSDHRPVMADFVMKGCA